MLKTNKVTLRTFSNLKEVKEVALKEVALKGLPKITAIDIEQVEEDRQNCSCSLGYADALGRECVTTVTPSFGEDGRNRVSSGYQVDKSHPLGR